METIMIVAAAWLLCGVLCAVLARGKRRSAWGWFFAGALFGPLGLVVGLLPKVVERNSVEEIHPEDEVVTLSGSWDAAYVIKAKSLRKDWHEVQNALFAELGGMPEFRAHQNDAEAIIATARSVRVSATHALKKDGAYITVKTAGIDHIDFGELVSRMTVSPEPAAMAECVTGRR